MSDRPVVLFDGVCNFCNGAVNFFIDRDPSGQLLFAPLQSETGKRLLAEHGLSSQGQDVLDTMVLVEGGRAYTRSTAGLMTLRHLAMPWPVLRVLLLVPRPVRDFFYRIFARNRYRWFGRTDACRAPTPEIRARFLDAAA